MDEHQRTALLSHLVTATGGGGLFASFTLQAHASVLAGVLATAGVVLGGVGAAGVLATLLAAALRGEDL